ncbi:PH domain containing protein [Plasmodium ovale wallikeri]|uniref:PH domain containing protein n=2 Tax=Plasmodium ovale TaxID=36330 RepID=A0A1A8YKE3_PLAOA|nr:PH domain containing protein [Plasmodium ovale wallikeri]SBT32354.1 PH domain containing protein [Plasmodium ovale wallikeri]SBT75729.1 PH domain-containing protein, putative [Plasmodium ovale]
MEIVNEGWVFKQSKYLKRMRKRYIILTKNFICSFKSQYYQGEKPTEILYLSKFTELTSTEDVRKIKLVESELGLTNIHVFNIRYNNRKILFVTMDKDEKNRWIKHISKQMIKPTVMLSE